MMTFITKLMHPDDFIIVYLFHDPKMGNHRRPKSHAVIVCFKINKIRLRYLSRYSINTYVRYLSYALLVIAELPNDELTGNHTLSLPPLYL